MNLFVNGSSHFIPLFYSDGHHVISRVETQLSDGTTQISNSLTPETAQLLSKLHPNMFPAASLMQVRNQYAVKPVIYGHCFGRPPALGGYFMKFLEFDVYSTLLCKVTCLFLLKKAGCLTKQVLL